MDMHPYKRNLLICFDAFGTLFKPKRPIAQQYAEVATSLGLHKFSEDEVQSSFIKAFKKESKAHPNYGKASDMNAEKWWTNIITNTFKPLLKANEELPAELAPKLLHRFWSKEGYELQPGAGEALRYLHEPSTNPNSNFDQIVVGVITNSDPRVPDVLSSLGLNISPLRYGTPAPERVEDGEADENAEHRGSKRGPDAMSTPEDRGDAKKTRVDPNTLQKYDVDFSVMSYDVGHEKPNVKIFRTAEDMLDAALKARGDTSTSRDSKAWEKIYVGDEYDKDVVGARNAKWNAVLISVEPVDDDETGVKWLEDEPGGDLMPLFRTRYDAVAFGSLHRIADWLHL